jgi:hypothetical protein
MCAYYAMRWLNARKPHLSPAPGIHVSDECLNTEYKESSLPHQVLNSCLLLLARVALHVLGYGWRGLVTVE